MDAAAFQAHPHRILINGTHQIPRKVTAVVNGRVMAEVQVQIDGGELVAA